MEEQYYIFRLINTVNNKTFIGVSKEPQKRMSQILSGHGSKDIKNDIGIFGKGVFLRQIIESHGDIETASSRSQKLITLEGSLFPYGYNRSIGGIGSTGSMWNMKSKARVSGSNNHKSKLTEVQVMEIYWDTRSRKEISEEYGISKTLVTKIKKGQVWKYLTQNIHIKKDDFY